MTRRQCLPNFFSELLEPIDRVVQRFSRLLHGLGHTFRRRHDAIRALRELLRMPGNLTEGVTAQDLPQLVTIDGLVGPTGDPRVDDIAHSGLLKLGHQPAEAELIGHALGVQAELVTGNFLGAVTKGYEAELRWAINAQWGVSATATWQKTHISGAAFVVVSPTYYGISNVNGAFGCGSNIPFFRAGGTETDLGFDPTDPDKITGQITLRSGKYLPCVAQLTAVRVP